MTDHRRGDFTEFATARRPHYRRLAYALCGDWHAAEDIVQNAFARLYVAWPRVRRSAAEDAYVRRAITRAAIASPADPGAGSGPGSTASTTPPAAAGAPAIATTWWTALLRLPGQDAAAHRRAPALAGPVGRGDREGPADLRGDGQEPTPLEHSNG